MHPMTGEFSPGERWPCRWPPWPCFTGPLAACSGWRCASVGLAVLALFSLGRGTHIGVNLGSIW